MKLKSILSQRKDLEFLLRKIQLLMEEEKNYQKHLKIDLFNFILMI